MPHVLPDRFSFAALLVENGKFLLSAKRTRRTTSTEYIISMNADNISRSSSNYIGKLRYENLTELGILYLKNEGEKRIA